MSGKYYLWISAVLMSLGVMFGAFGAHALRSMLDASLMQTWQTAVQYHLLHGVALLVLALYRSVVNWSVIDRVWFGLALGVLLFSGSLYAWVLSGWHGLVFLTPVGGMVWVVTWLYLAWSAFNRERSVE